MQDFLNNAEIISKAREWYFQHTRHVDRIVFYENNFHEYVSYPPSGSDAINPSLWRVPHWNWFFEQTNDRRDRRACETNKTGKMFAFLRRFFKRV